MSDIHRYARHPRGSSPSPRKEMDGRLEQWTKGFHEGERSPGNFPTRRSRRDRPDWSGKFDNLNLVIKRRQRRDDLWQDEGGEGG